MKKSGMHIHYSLRKCLSIPLNLIYFTASNQGSALKYISLVTLTLQNALLGLSMRYSRTREGDMFLSSTGKCQIIFRFYCYKLLKI